MEEPRDKVTLQIFLQNVIHTSGSWIDLPQWRRLGEENNIQWSTNHPLPMVVLQVLPPQQENRVHEKTRHERDDGQDQKSPGHKT